MTMRVLLDEKPCESPAETVSSAIERAAERARRNGRLIVEVFVDGERWQHPDTAAAHPAERTAREVAITTADATELVSEALVEAEDVLSELCAAQREAGELLQQGEDEPAMARLSDAVSHWLSLQQAVSMSVDVMHLQGISLAERADVERAVSELAQHLQMVRECLKHRDTLGLGDALLYDLPVAAEQWRNLVRQLRAAVIES